MQQNAAVYDSLSLRGDEFRRCRVVCSVDYAAGWGASVKVGDRRSTRMTEGVRVMAIGTDHAQTADPSEPPTVLLPKLFQQAALIGAPRRFLERSTARHGPVFTLRLPAFPPMVVVTDNDLARQIWSATSTYEIGQLQPNLGRMLGAESLFGLDGEDHRRRRKLITPMFHGPSMRAYRDIVVAEAERECASWPDDGPIATLEPMMRLTLNSILRAVFGAEGDELAELRELIPRWVRLGSLLTPLPVPPPWLRKVPPWSTIDAHRRRYDTLVAHLVDKTVRARGSSDQDGVIARLLHPSSAGSESLSRKQIADELLGLLVAGHASTATTLAWAFERISRHPGVLTTLTEEAMTTSDNLHRTAAILEVQRTRPVVNFVGRHVHGPQLDLGHYRIPHGSNIVVSVDLIHSDPEAFPNPDQFNPDRFRESAPGPAWITYGGGARRCVGASFAHMEIDAVLDFVLRRFAIKATNAAAEPIRTRGMASYPGKQGLIAVRRR